MVFRLFVKGDLKSKPANAVVVSLTNKSLKLRHSEHSEESSSLNAAKKYGFFAMLRMTEFERFVC